MKKSPYFNTITKDYLDKEYTQNRRNALELSKEIGCDRATIIAYLHYYDIPLLETIRRFPKGNQSFAWKGVGEISKTQLWNIFSNAKSRKIPVNVTPEQMWNQYLKQNRKCALTGREIGFTHARKGNASLDRIDSRRPYDIDNIWWLHLDVNLAKQSLPVHDFINLCVEVAQQYSSNSGLLIQPM